MIDIIDQSGTYQLVKNRVVEIKKNRLVENK